MTIIFATNGNTLKEQDVYRTFAGLDLKIVQMDLPKVNGSLDYQARMKARYAYSQLGQPVFCDSTGIWLHAFEDFPAEQTSEVMKIYDLADLASLGLSQKNHRASVRSYISLCLYQGIYKLFSGRMAGRIVSPNSPDLEPKKFNRIFEPSGWGKRLCDFTDEERNRYSHRGQALGACRDWLLNNNLR